MTAAQLSGILPGTVGKRASGSRIRLPTEPLAQSVRVGNLEIGVNGEGVLEMVVRGGPLTGREQQLTDAFQSAGLLIPIAEPVA
jgi:hypothetical protein